MPRSPSASSNDSPTPKPSHKKAKQDNLNEEIQIVKDAWGLDKLLERTSIKQQELVEESNRKLLTEFLKQSETKAAALVKESEEKW